MFFVSFVVDPLFLTTESTKDTKGTQRKNAHFHAVYSAPPPYESILISFPSGFALHDGSHDYASRLSGAERSGTDVESAGGNDNADAVYGGGQ